jgi:non-heme chloroperoxidase
MQAGLKNSCASVMSLLADFTEDLKRFDVPTLILHGDDDQVVPVGISAMRSAGIIKDAKEIIYPGAPHGITATHQDEVNSELLRFVES